MATKNFRSTVLDPTSEFAYGDKLRFTALSSINQVFKRSFSEVTIGIDGVYDIDLQYGKYRIDYKPYEGIWALFANVEVGAETTATTLQDLAMTSSPVTDDTILALQAILAETKVNAENSEKSSIDSIAAAAEAAQDRAEIEDLMLRAMTTSDVEAIRENNKNLFAASGIAEWGTVGSNPVNPLKNGLNCTATARTLLHDGKYHIAGLIFDIPDNSHIRFDDATDGKTTYNKSNSAVTKHDTVQAAFAAANADADIEVVTDRTDAYALEIYLRDITEADPMVYPHGYIHAQDTSINGIITSLDDIRPDSYYAHYVGEETVIRGKSVNWFAASNAEKLAVLSVADKHGYVHYDPKTGAWRQWCIRERTPVGMGNGDWDHDSNQSIDASRFIYGLTFAGGGAIAQGYLNAPANFQSVFWVAPGSSSFWAIKDHIHSGAFKATQGYGGISFDGAIDGECYLLVLGTVARLSHSVWHPSHNPMGCFKYTAANLNPLGQGITSKEQCFLPENIGTQSARPDGRLPTIIYGSGHGGVCRDMRYSAYHTTKEESDAKKFSVYNGTYRGFEKRVFTKILSERRNIQSGLVGDIAVVNEDRRRFSLGAVGHEISVGDIIYVNGRSHQVIYQEHGSQGVVYPAIDIDDLTFVGVGYGWSVFTSAIPTIISFKLSQSVGGDFTRTDVIGDPNQILLDPDLSNGWDGGWISGTPENPEAKHYTATRKWLAGVNRIRRDDGEWGLLDWDSQSSDILNSIYTSAEAASVTLCNYTAFAKQTRPSINAAVYGGSDGVGEVKYSAFYRYEQGYGVQFAESALGVALVSSLSGTEGGYSFLTKAAFSSSKLSSTDVSLHNSIILPNPNNESPAFKAIDYRVANNRQSSLNFAVTEIKWGADGWCGDSQIHIVDNESTLIDKNGNTVKVVTHTLAEPIGWVK